MYLVTIQNCGCTEECHRYAYLPPLPNPFQTFELAKFSRHGDLFATLHGDWTQTQQAGTPSCASLACFTHVCDYPGLVQGTRTDPALL